MSKKRNEQRELALKELVARFERDLDRQETPFLSQEQFEDLIGHYYDQGDYDRTLHTSDIAISQHAYTPEFYKWKALIHKINLEETEALETLEKLAIYAPNDQETMMLRLEVLVHFNKVEPATELLEILHSRITKPQSRSILYYFQGLVSLQQQDLESSWQSFMEAIRIDPSQEHALDETLNAGEFVHLRKHLEGTFRKLLDEDPFNHLIWYYLGMWYDDHGFDFKAMDAFANARSLNDKEARYELDYADKLFDLDRFEQALQVYTTYFTLPEAVSSYETFMRIGRSYQMLDDLNSARTAYFKAAEFEPEMYDSYQHLGECFAAEAKWGMAAHNYGRAIELAGHTAECWLGLALCLSALNETVEAEKAYRSAIEKGIRYSDATVALAIFLADTGQEVEALQLMEETLSEYEDANLVYGMVAVSLVCNRRARALEYLNEALSGYPNDKDLILEWYPNLRDDREINAIFQLHES